MSAYSIVNLKEEVEDSATSGGPVGFSSGSPKNSAGHRRQWAGRRSTPSSPSPTRRPDSSTRPRGTRPVFRAYRRHADEH